LILQAFNRAARFIFANKITAPNADTLSDNHVKPLLNEITTVLQQGFKAGISAEMPEGMKNYLSRSVSVFSGAKTFAELRQMSDLLIGENGLAKPFSTYFKDVRAIHNSYNQNYLKAEYIFATQSAQMADKWADFEKYGDRYLLQYRTAFDDRVREQHRPLHNTTLPKGDSFWTEYFPPNGWRCRCTAVQVRRGKYTESNSQQAQALGAQATEGKQNIFRFNPGKQGAIFPENHPYFPKNCATCQMFGKQENLSADKKKNCYQCTKMLEAVKKSNAENAKIAEYKKEYNSLNPDVWKKNYFDEQTGGYLATEHARINQAKKSKKEGAVFNKEQKQCMLLAKNGDRVRHINDSNGGFDIYLNNTAAELKCLSSELNIENEALNATRKKKAKLVVFEFEKETRQIHTKIKKLIELKIHGKYWFKGVDVKIYDF
jgi:SPP1 gp7 family putative phage head morphogenesis protein